MLAMVGMVLGPALLSRAQVCLAPSSWRRLLMQAVCLALALARMKLGMAMVASSPMMATTIMISTRVKPELRRDLIFMFLSFFAMARTGLQAGYYYFIIVRVLPATTTA